MQLVAQRDEGRKAGPFAVGEIGEERFAFAQLRDVDELAANFGVAPGRREERLELLGRQRLAAADEDVEGKLEPIGALLTARRRNVNVEREAGRRPAHLPSE